MDRKRLLRNPLIWIVVFFLVYLGRLVAAQRHPRVHRGPDVARPPAGRDPQRRSEITIEDKEQRLRLTLINPDAGARAPTAPRPRRPTRSTRSTPPRRPTRCSPWSARTRPRSGFDTRVTQDSILTQMLIYLIPLGLVLLLLFWMMNSQGGGNRVLSFGKSKAKQLNKDMPKTTFSDVAGANEAVEELYEIKDFLQNPARYQAARREDPQGRPALRPARHRQDAAGPRGRRRGGRALLHDLRLGLRRDVRRRRRLPRARPVRAGQAELPLHRVRRRDRRRRPPPRRRHGRRPRRARADAQPAARRDGRLRRARRHHPHRRHQPARHPRPRAAAPRPLRPPDPGGRAGPRRPSRDPRGALRGQAAGARRRTSTVWPSARSGSPAPTSPTSSTRPRC